MVLTRLKYLFRRKDDRKDPAKAPAKAVDQKHQKDSGYEQSATRSDELPRLSQHILEIPRIKVDPNLDFEEDRPYSSSSLTPFELASAGDSIRWDARSRQSRSDSTGDLTQWLKTKLREQRFESYFDTQKYFVPSSVLETLITVKTVTKEIQARNPNIDEEEAFNYARQVCLHAKRLYAILAFIKKGGDICALLAEGVTDADLPLVRTKNARSRFALYRQNRETVKTMEFWQDKHLEKFDRYQWWMNAPFFHVGKHHEFNDQDVLPFMRLREDESNISKKQGAYSEVYPVRIHPAHHDFWAATGLVENEPLIAVKQLFSDDEGEFLKEVSILRAVGPKNHPHLIKLLATYKQKRVYHLMFPYASANLRTYWDERAMPTFDKRTLLWSLRQMKGIASGLHLIHNFSTTYPLSPGENAHFSVKKGEEMYGRHGDIKPENILWFEAGAKTDDITDDMGTLQIADFGLGRFHGRDSRSGIPAYGIVSSPTYEPPECKLQLPVSRAYDIWSLGCIYLEFITWLLRGSAEIDGFANFRGRIATGTGINDDNFFTIVSHSDCRHAIVRDTVISWIHGLHCDAKCTEVLHDLLKFIMTDLLVVESRDRCNASVLLQHLMRFAKKAENDDDYLLKPVPRVAQASSSRPSSIEASRMASPVTRQPSVRFAEATKTGPTHVIKIAAGEEPMPNLVPVNSKDLVLRNVVTISPNSRLQRQVTWPG